MIPSQISRLDGLHLFYNPYSNCSERVMLLCAEKGLTPKMYELDLMRGDQLTDEFRAINPNCDVPAIVHNGNPMGDSITIMRYLESTFPAVSLTPAKASDKESMERLLDEASKSHMEIIVPYLYAAGIGRLPTPEQKSYYDKYVPYRSAFHNDRLAGKVATDNYAAERAVKKQLEMLDDILAEQAWLAGETYSMADIAWFANTIVLRTLGYKIPDVPNVKAWIKTIEQRPAYQTGIKAHFKPIPNCLLRGIMRLSRKFGNRK